MNRLKEFIEKNISGKKVLGLFIVTNIVYLVMLMGTIPHTMGYSNGLKLLDMMPTGYNFEYVTNLFDSLGEIGRTTYLTTQLPVDMVYPFLFGLSYCLLLGYFLQKLHRLNTSFLYLCLLPVLAGISDYLENVGIIMMLKSYPDLTSRMVHATNIFSLTKSISTSLFFITLIVLILLLGYTTIKRKISATKNT